MSVISCTMGALWSTVQTDLGNYNQRLQLLFIHFYELDMWPTSQQPMAWTLTHRIIMILYFLTFWSYISFWFSGYNVLVTIFGNVHRPCRHYFIIVNRVSILFFLIFWLYLHQLPYWEMCTDHVINASRLPKESTSSLLFFSWFFLIFLLYLHELPY